MRAARLALLAVAALLALPATAQARSLGLALISKGVKNPLFVTTTPGDSSRIFIVLKGGWSTCSTTGVCSSGRS